MPSPRVSSASAMSSAARSSLTLVFDPQIERLLYGVLLAAHTAGFDRAAEELALFGGQLDLHLGQPALRRFAASTAK
jgi:hypothetical protein